MLSVALVASLATAIGLAEQYYAPQATENISPHYFYTYDSGNELEAVAPEYLPLDGQYFGDGRYFVDGQTPGDGQDFGDG